MAIYGDNKAMATNMVMVLTDLQRGRILEGSGNGIELGAVKDDDRWTVAWFGVGRRCSCIC